MKKSLVLFLSLICLIWSGCVILTGCTSSTPDPSKSTVSKEDTTKIKNGISKDEVISILGNGYSSSVSHENDTEGLVMQYKYNDTEYFLIYLDGNDAMLWQIPAPPDILKSRQTKTEKICPPNPTLIKSVPE